MDVTADIPTLRTSRLLLRAWRQDDLIPFAALNADERVATWMGRSLSPPESDAQAQRFMAAWARHGVGIWALEVNSGPPFIGFVGLGVPSFEAPFMPCVEIGWRLAPAYWGQGFATEGAKAALRFGFEDRAIPEIVAFTTLSNKPSWRVMEKIGMTRDLSADFDHPRHPSGSSTRRQILYRRRNDSVAAALPGAAS